MIYTEDGTMKVNGIVLPGVVKSIEVKESAWWRLEPGQAGYELPVWSYCGMTREQWELRKLRRGWR